MAGLAGLEPALTRLEDERSCPSELQALELLKAMVGVEPTRFRLRDERSSRLSYIAV